MAGVAVQALVPAAGSGERCGGEVPKQYREIAGKPVLRHVLERLADHPGLAGITIALAPEDGHFERLGVGAGLPLMRVDGGLSRARSVFNGLGAIASGTDATWVLVHDAARPCLPRTCLDRLLDALPGHPEGVILALPVGDTLKRGDQGGRIGETLDRTGLWAAQTPQLFPLRVLHRALGDALAAGEEPTDEAAAMERAGYRPGLIRGSVVNFKITWPEDLDLAAAWLATGAQ